MPSLVRFFPLEFGLPLPLPPLLVAAPRAFPLPLPFARDDELCRVVVFVRPVRDPTTRDELWPRFLLTPFVAEAGDSVVSPRSDAPDRDLVDVLCP